MRMFKILFFVFFSKTFQCFQRVPFNSFRNFAAGGMLENPRRTPFLSQQGPALVRSFGFSESVSKLLCEFIIEKRLEPLLKTLRFLSLGDSAIPVLLLRLFNAMNFQLLLQLASNAEECSACSQENSEIFITCAWWPK